nr:MAG: ribosomal protein S8E [Candidatus Nanosalinarum sp. J07AB56]
MTENHGRSTRTKSGSRNRRYRKPRKHEMGSAFSAPQIGDEFRTEDKETRGGDKKNFVRTSDRVNLAVDGEVKNVDIQAVEDNPANSEFVRRSLLTKGTIIQTTEGKARITSRPGQDGNINAVSVD